MVDVPSCTMENIGDEFLIARNFAAAGAVACAAEPTGFEAELDFVKRERWVTHVLWAECRAGQMGSDHWFTDARFIVKQRIINEDACRDARKKALPGFANSPDVHNTSFTVTAEVESPEKGAEGLPASSRKSQSSSAKTRSRRRRRPNWSAGERSTRWRGSECRLKTRISAVHSHCSPLRPRSHEG